MFKHNLHFALERVTPQAEAPQAYAESAAGMRGKRRAEFLAGRRAAHRALARAGAPHGPVARGADSAPVWPAGWSGSITHDSRRALAVVAPGPVRIGIDLEDLTRTQSAQAAAALCLSPEETRIFETPCAVLCAFSAKEAVFKAMAPGSASRFWLAGIHLKRETPDLLSWSLPEIGMSGHTRLYLTRNHVVSLCVYPT